MKPDAVDAGLPKYEVGDLVYWTHDMFMGNEYPIRGEAIVVNNTGYDICGKVQYSIHMLLTGTVLVVYEKNIEHHKTKL